MPPGNPTLRAITLDVGWTFLHVRPSVGHVYAAVAAQWTGRRFDPALLNRRFQRAWRRQNHFDHSRAAWMAVVDETFAGLVPEPPSRTFFGLLYRRFAQPDVWKPDPNLPGLLAQLRAHGFRLGIISNWDLRLRPLLHALGLAGSFDVIVISAEVGFAKPDPAIFLRAADDLGLAPQEILHVGDDLHHDFLGARQAGLQSVLLQPGTPAPTARKIGSLRQLPAWLRLAGFLPSRRR
jgi:putative hydrolase of the HAD superfamily